MAYQWKQKILMEETTDGKRKAAPSIPANYITILQLQERWINEKERKKKEDERQRRMDEDLKQAEVTRKRNDLSGALERSKFEEKRIDRSNYWDRNSRKKESIDGGEARSAEKIETQVTAEIGSEKCEDTAPIDEGLLEKERGRGRRKRYNSKKKKQNQDVVECGSIASPEIIMTENKTPVKDVIQVYMKEGEKPTGTKSIGSREKAVTDDATAIETKFKKISINEGETKNLKAQTRSVNRNRLNQRHDLHPQGVRSPFGTGKMVWVKKGQYERPAE